MYFRHSLNVFFATYAITQALDARKFYRKNVNSINNDLSDGIRFFYDNFFFKAHKTCIILMAVQNKYGTEIQDLKHSIMSNHQNKVDYIFSIEDHTYVKVTPYMSRDAIIVLIDSFQSFAIFEKSLTSDRFNLHGHYLFVLIKRLWNENEMQNFTSILWTKGIINFNVIFEIADQINFTSIRPFHSSSCSDLSLRLLNTFKDGKFQKETKSILFPKGE